MRAATEEQDEKPAQLVYLSTPRYLSVLQNKIVIFTLPLLNEPFQKQQPWIVIL